MKKLLFSLFSIFNIACQAIEIDMSILNDISKDISNGLAVPTIVGPDDRKEITGKAVGPEKAVIIIEKQGKLHCSGAMVGPNIVLTAAHCLFNEDGNYETGLIVYAVGLPSLKIPPGEGDPLYKIRIETLSSYLNLYPDAAAKELWVPDQYIQATLSARPNQITEKQRFYDYGFIILDNDLGNKTHRLGLKVPSNEELNEANVIAIGRSSDKPSRSLWKSPGQIGEVEKYFVYHNVDIIGGDSGSPLFKENDPKNIIALNTSGFGQFWVSIGFIDYPNCALRIRQEMIDALKNLEKEISETNKK